MSILQGVQSGLTWAQGKRNYLDNLANKYIVKPNSFTDEGSAISGFVFDYEGETTVTMQADITDHYTEDNSAIQDHIAIKPIRITLRGFVAELVKVKPTGLTGAIQKLSNALSIVPAYIGDYTPGVVQSMQNALLGAQNAVNTADQALNRVQNIVDMFGQDNTISKNKQQKAYAQLEQLFNTKQKVVVQTPYKIFDNMYIESLSFSQDETTKYITDIQVTLKQLRFASVQAGTLDTSQFAGAAAFQRQDPVTNGQTTGDKKTFGTSLLYAGLGLGQ